MVEEQEAGGYLNPANIAHGKLLGVDNLRSSCENSGHIFRTGEVFGHMFRAGEVWSQSGCQRRRGVQML